MRYILCIGSVCLTFGDDKASKTSNDVTAKLEDNYITLEIMRPK